jgi:uncharacterized protein YrzB (UPF0473 family)
MSDFGNDFVTLTDDEGNEQEYEHLGSINYGGTSYMAFIPAYEGEPDDMLEGPAELLILKAITDDKTGEELLSTVDDQEELREVYERFMRELEDYWELEPEEGELH